MFIIVNKHCYVSVKKEKSNRGVGGGGGHSNILLLNFRGCSMFDETNIISKEVLMIISPLQEFWKLNLLFNFCRFVRFLFTNLMSLCLKFNLNNIPFLN